MSTPEAAPSAELLAELVRRGVLTEEHDTQNGDTYEIAPAVSRLVTTWERVTP